MGHEGRGSEGLDEEAMKDDWVREMKERGKEGGEEDKDREEGGGRLLLLLLLKPPQHRRSSRAISGILLVPWGRPPSGWVLLSCG